MSHAALLTAGVGVKFIVEHNGGDFFTPNPGMKGHIKTDVGGRAVAGHNHHVLVFIGKTELKPPFEPGCHCILVAEEGMDIMNGQLRENQAVTAGGTDDDRIFRRGQGGNQGAEGHSQIAAGTEGMIFNKFFE